MNWFIYVGGGSIFWLITYAALNTLFSGRDKMGKDAQNLVLRIISISPILVWIWICWKFIR